MVIEPIGVKPRPRYGHSAVVYKVLTQIRVTYTYTCTCTYTYTCTCTYIYTCTCTYTYTRTCIYVHCT